MVFDLQKLIDDTAEAFISAGVAPELAKQEAAKDVERMGVTKVYMGKCPLKAQSPHACMFCHCGHMTECHWPLTCVEAQCSHFKRYQEF
jgi:hypothetical protein